jgi:hypothetical protein
MLWTEYKNLPAFRLQVFLFLLRFCCAAAHHVLALATAQLAALYRFDLAHVLIFRS